MFGCVVVVVGIGHCFVLFCGGGEGGVLFFLVFFHVVILFSKVFLIKCVRVKK